MGKKVCSRSVDLCPSTGKGLLPAPSNYVDYLQLGTMDRPEEQKASGTWKKFKGRIQEAWGDLTGDELDQYQGQREQLEGHLEKKTGESREEIRRKLDEISNKTKYNF